MSTETNESIRKAIAIRTVRAQERRAADKVSVEALVAEGKTAKEIAADLNRSRAYIYKLIHDLGLTPVHGNSAQGQPVDMPKAERWAEVLKACNMNQAAAARELGVTRQAISHFVSRYGDQFGVTPRRLQPTQKESDNAGE